MLARNSVALGLAIVLGWTSPVLADELVPSVSLQTGVTYTRGIGNDSDDYFVAATPQLTYVLDEDRISASVTYSFTGSINSFLPNSFANRGAATLAYDIDPRTQLLFGAEAIQASLGNYLLVRRSADTVIGGIPLLNANFLTLTGTQGISHEISENVLFTQLLTGQFVKQLDEGVRNHNYLAAATFDLSRSWQFDAVGGELALQYSRTFFPPIERNIGTVALGPTWDHDFNANLSGSAALLAQVAYSKDPGTRARLAPAGRASLLYYSESSGIEARYDGGYQPDLLIGTLLESSQATLRGYTAISERNKLTAGISAGYLRATTLDLVPGGGNANQFDAVLHDADITWAPTELMQVYVRYQFIGQTAGIGAAASPAIVRHAILFGVDLFGSRPIGRRRVQNRFPQRVDRSDVPSMGGPRMAPVVGPPGVSPGGGSPGGSTGLPTGFPSSTPGATPTGPTAP